MFAIGILLNARQFGVPKVVQARMLINVAIDTLVGMVPVVGDLFDFAWKSNHKNLELLELHAREERRGSVADYAFVTLMILLVLSLAVLPFALFAWLMSAIGTSFF